MTKTVYIPVKLKSKSDITEDQAIDLANSIVSMIQEGFFSEDNVFDEATEQDIDLEGFSICEAVPASSFVRKSK